MRLKPLRSRNELFDSVHRIHTGGMKCAQILMELILNNLICSETKNIYVCKYILAIECVFAVAALKIFHETFSWCIYSSFSVKIISSLKMSLMDSCFDCCWCFFIWCCWCWSSNAFVTFNDIKWAICVRTLNCGRYLLLKVRSIFHIQTYNTKIEAANQIWD